MVWGCAFGFEPTAEVSMLLHPPSAAESARGWKWRSEGDTLVPCDFALWVADHAIGWRLWLD
jgi:hypothetical protein